MARINIEPWMIEKVDAQLKEKGIYDNFINFCSVYGIDELFRRMEMLKEQRENNI